MPLTVKMNLIVLPAFLRIPEATPKRWSRKTQRPS